MDLSICMIVKNEAENLSQLLPQLRALNCELCIVDTGSTDGSITIIKESVGVVHHFEWCENFSLARNYSLSLASKPTILWLDADDRLPERSIIELQQLCDIERTIAYTAIVENPREGMVESEKFRQLRIIPNGRGLQFKGAIHEELRSSCIVNEIPVEDSKFVIEHRGYMTVENRAAKTERNYKLLKKEYECKSDDLYVVMEYGNALYQKAQYRDALTVYETGYHNPQGEKNTHAYVTLPLLIGNTYEVLGELDTADEWFDISVRLHPIAYTAHYKLARSRMGVGAWESAQILYTQIVEGLEQERVVGTIAQSSHALYVNSLTALALGYNDAQQFDQACLMFEKVLENHGAITFDPWVYMGSLVALEKYDVAQSFIQLHHCTPSVIAHEHTLAKMLLGVGQLEGACEEYKRLLQRDPTNSIYINEYGVVLYQQGSIRDAQHCFLGALHQGYSDDCVENLLDTIGVLKNSSFVLDRLKYIPIESAVKEQLIYRIKGLYAKC
ncbi:MAG: glycosyltransferase [Fibrobacterales bacterium]